VTSRPGTIEPPPPVGLSPEPTNHQRDARWDYLRDPPSVRGTLDGTISGTLVRQRDDQWDYTIDPTEDPDGRAHRAGQHVGERGRSVQLPTVDGIVRQPWPCRLPGAVIADAWVKRDPTRRRVSRANG
jgi:hypothetical protein